MLSDEEIERLLAQRSISNTFPWADESPSVVESFYKGVCSGADRKLGTKSRVEWNHYGSGYASFVDAWFYKSTDGFFFEYPGKFGEAYHGLAVLLCRLAPYFVLLQGEKTWAERGGSSYMPTFECIDEFKTPAVSSLAIEMQDVLEGYGLVRLKKEDLAKRIDPKFQVFTNLSDRPYTEFDALFYWED
ncbi:hypothetical protein HPT27_07390 [Permianibacter sp. IMCC34836]|uniref:hypothetical protein n=1 Tax=Permianibacter fluminis TaxID=2738515 RepID=UPI0015557A88|nr:hypothetical protein [Permianibacter fluminis]NQD36846.1 hypothetical protein [Permianibacter fluminis]